jgi:hypothetical protein
MATILTKDNVLRFSVTNVKFQILKNRSKGRAVFKYEVVFKNDDGTEERKPFIASAMIVCIWPDSTGNCAKAYMKVNRENRALMVLISLIKMHKVVACPDDMFLSGNENSLRYGPAAEKIHAVRGDEWIDYFYYDSAAMAIASIINQIKTYKQVSGIACINLGMVEDSVLLEVGFERIADVFGRGPDMWCGNPDRFLDASEGWSSSRYETSKNNAVSFLASIKTSLDKISVVPEEPAAKQIAEVVAE